MGVLAFFLCIAISPAVRAETITLTIDEAVRRALDNSLNLKKSAIDLAQTEYSANNLWSEIFPGFSLSAGLTFLPSTPLLTDPGFTYNKESLSYSINFGVSLSLNPSLSASMKRIDLAYRSQLLSYENARMQLEIQVVKNFLTLFTRKANISYMEENLRIAEGLLQSNRIARQNGLLSELALLNSQLSVETARYNLGNAQGVYQNALVEFLALLGIEAGTDIIYSGTIGIAPITSDPEQLILEYLPKRPDIISQRQTIERLEFSKNITSLNSRSPSLELGAQWRGGSPTGGTRKDGLLDPFSDSVSGSLTLRIPIDSWIPGTRQNQTVRAADAEVEKARLDLQNTEIQAKTQIRSLISNLRNTWASLEIAKLRLQFAERTLEATDEGFKKGTVEFQELEDTRNKLTDARQQLLQGELSCQTLLLDLAAALNVDWKTLAAQEAGES